MIDYVRKGAAYVNAKGKTRCVVKFESVDGKELDVDKVSVSTPANVLYTSATGGNVRSCFISTFASWAKSRKCRY